MFKVLDKVRGVPSVDAIVLVAFELQGTWTIPEPKAELLPTRMVPLTSSVAPPKVLGPLSVRAAPPSLKIDVVRFPWSEPALAPLPLTAPLKAMFAEPCVPT